MKVVVAEKISSSAMELLKRAAVGQSLPRISWTANSPPNWRAADALIVRLGRCRSSAALLEHADKLRVDRPRRRRRRQHRTRTRHPQRDCGYEYSRSQCRRRRRTDPRRNAGHGPPPQPRRFFDARRQVGKEPCKAPSCAGKTLGIIGLGKIGMEVARRARSFAMEVIAHDPFVSLAVAKEQGIRMAKLEEVYAAADYLTLHVGLDTADHRHDQR